MRPLIKYSWILLFALLPYQSESSADHAIYISVIEVDHDARTVRIKTFSDDLMNGLKSIDKKIYLGADPCLLESPMLLYIQQYFRLSMNGKRLPLTILDCAIESDTHWITLKYDFEKEVNRLKIETDWLTDLFLNQQNIIKVKIGNQRQNGRLNASTTSFEYQF